MVGGGIGAGRADVVIGGEIAGAFVVDDSDIGPIPELRSTSCSDDFGVDFTRRSHSEILCRGFLLTLIWF